MQIIVTPVENVIKDENGNYLYDDEGDLKLLDEENVGILMKTHVIPLTAIKDGVASTGTAQVSEVLWNQIRSPAPALVSPNDLAWLTINEVDQDADEEEEEHEEGEEVELVDGEEFEEAEYDV